MDAILKRRLYAAFPQEGNPSLDALTTGLFEGQMKSWPGLAGGHAALEAAGVREIRGDRWVVKVQFNPRRMVSSGAKLDPESIRKRPCFLCLTHLPPEQQAIHYRDTFLVVCNPAPIYPGHLTIVHRRHLPQSILGNLEILLRLAADFGPRMIVSYNGPRCGASAPDHLHFQAAPAGLLPMEDEVLDPRNRVGVRRRGGVSLWRTGGLGRGILVIEGKSAQPVSSVFSAVIAGLGGLTGSPSRETRLVRGAEGCIEKRHISPPGSPGPLTVGFDPSGGEPMLNLFCTHTGEGWRLILFPRLRHRPAAYDRQGKEKLLVSPGAADMGGIFITPREKDFLALDRERIEGIFREVALDDAAVESLLETL